MDREPLSPLSEEFASAKLGDVRLTRRLMLIAEAAAANPSGSLPERAGSDVALEGVYRLFGNKKVTPERVLDAHVGCTVERAKRFPYVLAIHDTTEFSFGGDDGRDGLGWLNYEKRQGFLSHISICVAPDGEPLGTLRLFAWTRLGQPKGKRSQQESQYDPDRESLRWYESCAQVDELLDGKTAAIHVMDREGDCYELLSQLLESGLRFTVRVCYDRRLSPGRTGDTDKLFDVLSAAPLFFERQVPLSTRGIKGRAGKLKAFPARKQRLARLEVRAQRMEIFAGNGAPHHCPKSLELNFVEVREACPPEGEEPVIWRLVTTEPIDSEHDVAAVVDTYLRRWIIEEFFKAVKTGCNYEKRQLESSRALLIDLSIECAVAWRLLQLRWLAHTVPDAPASNVLQDTEILVLVAYLRKKKRPFPDDPTTKDALYAVAGLGGHLRNNGPPGWLVLRRGFEKLQDLVEGWLMATEITQKL
jgi:hypothetical protein